ncbi:hypothetical protein [Pelagibaculum spongiae]|uniref:Uncharacterized protein n=1 Tax=Pelagibaculum spongiae TaxID=2080658 RepID=A0A2V1GZ96_9GAMM|nr:hypothetical protein [Pelagibaculum spongiae]PVZ68386.1 hypothetical protein DC094_13995 [Pelagibaculum spongiae]
MFRYFLLFVFTFFYSALNAEPATQQKIATNNSWFKVSKDEQYNGLCQALTQFMNQQPWEALQSCTVPDMSDSPFEAVIFTPAAEEDLAKLDRIVDPYFYLYEDADEIWQKRKRLYQNGELALKEAWLDINNDQITDHVVEYSSINSICLPLGYGDYDQLKKSKEQLWNNISLNERKKLAEKYGFFKSYHVVVGYKKEGVFSSPSGLFKFKGQTYGYESSLSIKDTATKWAIRDFLETSYVSTIKQNTNPKLVTTTGCWLHLNKRQVENERLPVE